MSTSKSEAFLWGGVISLFVGLVGTGVSTYFVVTSKDNDPNATTKKVGLSMSVVVAVIGIILILYYYKGSMFDSTGSSSCPVADAIEQAAASPMNSEPDFGSQAPAPPKTGATTFNINVNPQPPK